MKKTYQAPTAQIVELEAQLPLALSGAMDGEGKDNVDFESIEKGWNSDSRTADED